MHTYLVHMSAHNYSSFMYVLTDTTKAGIAMTRQPVLCNLLPLLEIMSSRNMKWTSQLHVGHTLQAQCKDKNFECNTWRHE